MTEPAIQPPSLEPYRAALEGWTSGPEEWPNTVVVAATSGWAPLPPPASAAEDTAADYADLPGERQFVEVDTNYKTTRTGDHPVRLTRTAALELATHLIVATEDTFHYGRVGRLTAAQAAELLHAVDNIEHALQDLREHALQDLLHDSGIDE